MKEDDLRLVGGSARANSNRARTCFGQGVDRLNGFSCRGTRFGCGWFWT